MIDDIFMIRLPIYQVKFEENKNYDMSTKRGKKNLRDILLETGKGYCMYCYSKINIDKKNYGHLEHTVESKIVPDLKKCHYNLSIACPTCNSSSKSKEEKQRRIGVESFICDKVNCMESPCKDYYLNTNKYLNNMIEKKLEKIIMQPRGIIESYTGEKNYFEIEYNLLQQEFVPLNNKEYSEKVIKYIKSHIDKFNLNDEEYRTEEIKKVVEYVIEYENIPKKDYFNNYIAELFIEKLEVFLKESSSSKMEKVKKICIIIREAILLKYR